MKKKIRDFALIYVNGQRLEVRGDDALLMLADWLRKVQGLTGTKIVCAEGDCGACSVLRAFPALGGKGRPPFVAINSCITTVAQMDGSHLVTVEGLALNGQASPVQEAMTRCHGSQCGFCTPGFVVALTALTEAHPEPLQHKTALNGLTGNLCRCTGYEPIAAAAVQVKSNPSFSPASRYLTATSLKDLRQAQGIALCIVGQRDRFLAPITELEALRCMGARAEITGAGPPKVIGGGTDLGVQRNKGKLGGTTFLSLHLVRDFYRTENKGDQWSFGARVTLEEVRRSCRRGFAELSDLLNIFASPQIKNNATLVGNVANGSPIGDTLPLLLVAGGQVHLSRLAKGRVARRQIPIEQFYTGYRQTVLGPGELITHVSLRAPSKTQVCRFYKVSQRKDLDISALSAAFFVQKMPARRGSATSFGEVRVAFGGIAAVAKRLPEVERDLSGAPRTEDVFKRAAASLGQAIEPISDARASAAFRKVVAENLLRRFWEEPVP